MNPFRRSATFPLFFFVLCVVLFSGPLASVVAQQKEDWQAEWERTVGAAKKEGIAGTARAEREGKKETPAAKGAAKGEKTARPSVAAAMRRLFAERGLDATYAQAEAAARAAKPDTKFGKSHWSWYRAQHKKKGAAPASRKAQA